MIEDNEIEEITSLLKNLKQLQTYIFAPPTGAGILTVGKMSVVISITALDLLKIVQAEADAVQKRVAELVNK